MKKISKKVKVKNLIEDVETIEELNEILLNKNLTPLEKDIELQKTDTNLSQKLIDDLKSSSYELFCKTDIKFLKSLLCL